MNFQVDFEEFHELFVNILCRTYSTKQASSDEEEEDSETDEEEMEGAEESRFYYTIIRA